jgi:hypothetical protein
MKPKKGAPIFETVSAGWNSAYSFKMKIFKVFEQNLYKRKPNRPRIPWESRYKSFGLNQAIRCRLKSLAGVPFESRRKDE